MTWVTKNIRTHRLVLRDSREFAITAEQYKSIRANKEISKRNDPFTLKDIDSWKMLFDWEFWDVKEFKEIEHQSSDIKVICDYGWRHNLHWWNWTCDCKNRYNWFPALYILPALRYLWFKEITHPKWINSEVRTKLYNATKNSEFLKEVQKFYTNFLEKK